MVVSKACGRTRRSGTTGRNKAEDFNKFLGMRVDVFPEFVSGARHFSVLSSVPLPYGRTLHLTSFLFVSLWLSITLRLC